jgi:hypothetical protein
VEPASQHQDPRLTAQPPSAFSGRARGSLAVVSLLTAWLCTVALLFAMTPHPEGTDSSRFSEELSGLYAEIFVWHESMYIFPGEWVPDETWREALKKKIAVFDAEMARLPSSPCADEARAIVQRQGTFMAQTKEAMPAVERAWKDTIDSLPLTCGEF